MRMSFLMCSRTWVLKGESSGIKEGEGGDNGGFLSRSMDRILKTWGV